MPINVKLPESWIWASGALPPLGKVFSWHERSSTEIPDKHFMVCRLQDGRLHLEIADLTVDEPGGTLYGADFEWDKNLWYPDADAIQFYLGLSEQEWAVTMLMTYALKDASEFDWAISSHPLDSTLRAALSTSSGRSAPFMQIIHIPDPEWDGDSQDGPDPDDLRDAEIFDAMVRDAENSRD